MTASIDPTPNQKTVEFVLNGVSVRASDGESILEAATRNGVQIPRLCYKPGLRSDGNCRACMVEIAGERVLAPEQTEAYRAWHAFAFCNLNREQGPRGLLDLA